jgi:hypothetical protein
MMLLMALGVALPASAYIGPGVGLGTIAIIVAIGVAVVLLLVGFVWYPLKRLMRRGKDQD